MGNEVGNEVSRRERRSDEEGGQRAILNGRRPGGNVQIGLVIDTRINTAREARSASERHWWRGSPVDFLSFRARRERMTEPVEMGEVSSAQEVPYSF